MPPPTDSRSHRFLEVLVFFILTISLLGEDVKFDVLFFIRALSAVLLVVVRFYRSVRRFAWVCSLFAGLASLIVPQVLEGALLILLTAYLIFDSGWPDRYSVPAVAALVVVAVAIQTGGLILRSDNPMDVVRALVADSLMAGLAALFRKDLLATKKERPILHLIDFGLSEREGQIIHLIWGGETPREIAGFLKMSEGTLRKALSRIYPKVGVLGLKELSQVIYSHQVI